MLQQTWGWESRSALCDVCWGNTNLTGSPGLLSPPSSSMPWRRNTERSSTSPSQRERSSPQNSSWQKPRWGIGSYFSIQWKTLILSSLSLQVKIWFQNRRAKTKRLQESEMERIRIASMPLLPRPFGIPPSLIPGMTPGNLSGIFPGLLPQSVPSSKPWADWTEEKEEESLPVLELSFNRLW